MAEIPLPSPFLLRHRETLCDATATGFLLDLACGRGRHSRAALGWGLTVVALDRDRQSLRELATCAALSPRPTASRLLPVCADAEAGHPLPFAPGSLRAIVVTRFLHRPLAPTLIDGLAPGGVLLYETFTERQRELGTGPRNPDYLLQEGELLRLFAPLQVLDYEEGLRKTGSGEWVASLLGRRRPAAPG